jgi:hypothetical protein
MGILAVPESPKEMVAHTNRGFFVAAGGPFDLCREFRGGAVYLHVVLSRSSIRFGPVFRIQKRQ